MSGELNERGKEVIQRRKALKNETDGDRGERKKTKMALTYFCSAASADKASRPWQLL
jgi:hypothetical protein